MATRIYRGFTIGKICLDEDSPETLDWQWADDKGQIHGPFANEEAAMNDIDRYKREQRQSRG